MEAIGVIAVGAIRRSARRCCRLSHRQECRGKDEHPSRHTPASCDSYRLHPRRVPWLPISDIDDAVNNGVGRLPFSCHSLTLARRRTTSALNTSSRLPGLMSIADVEVCFTSKLQAAFLSQEHESFMDFGTVLSASGFVRVQQ